MAPGARDQFGKFAEALSAAAMQPKDIIDTEQLRAFEAVAATRSFTGAARLLGTAQSSVSQQVARLERRAGQTLVRRTTRLVELTPAGDAMLVYVRSILAIADDVRHRLSAPPFEGVLRVGIADEFATTKLSGVLGIFRRHHPNFEMRFLTGRNDYLCDALESGDVDIILAKCHSGRKKGELLWRERLVWLRQPWVLKTPNAPVPLVTYLRPSETRDVVEAALLKAHRPWVVVAQCANLLGIFAAVDAGLGVMALGRNFIPPGLTELPGDAGLPHLGTLDYVIDRRAAHSDPAVDDFAKVLRQFAEQLIDAQTEVLPE
jgi:DNA-binding transcriptional LysR family regulator